MRWKKLLIIDIIETFHNFEECTIELGSSLYNEEILNNFMQDRHLEREINFI